METTSQDRTKVWEGSLRSSGLLKVHRMLDSGGIAGLSQDKPVPTETTRVSQIVQISIFRTDHWQNLQPISQMAGDASVWRRDEEAVTRS